MEILFLFGLIMQDKANPLATILSAAMLLKYGLGEVKAAERIELAVLNTLNKGFRTGDIYSAGNVCTLSFSKGYYCHFGLCLLIVFMCRN